MTSATSHAQPVYSLPSTRQHLQPRGPSALPPPPRDRPTREHRSVAARRVVHRATVESASAPCGSPMVVRTPACPSCSRAEAQPASASQGASASVDDGEPDPRSRLLLQRTSQRRVARASPRTSPRSFPCAPSPSPCRPLRRRHCAAASPRPSGHRLRPSISLHLRRIFRADRRLASNPRRAHDAPSPPSSAAATPPPRAAQTPSSPRSTTCTPSASITRLRA